MEISFFNDSSRWQKTREWWRGAAEPFIEHRHTPAAPRGLLMEGGGTLLPQPPVRGGGRVFEVWAPHPSPGALLGRSSAQGWGLRQWVLRG